MRRMRPSGRNLARPYGLLGGPAYVLPRRVPDATSHRDTWPALAMANSVPSGLKAIELAKPTIVGANCCQFEVSRKVTEPLIVAEASARIAPSGENAKLLTFGTCG